MDKPAKLLIVEDDPGLGHAIKVAFEGAGLSVHLAASSLAALDYLDASETIAGLVADVRLGEGQPHGFALARMARYRRPSLACVFLTGFDLDPDDERAAMGPVLHKPVDLDELVRVVKAELLNPRT
jgi:CheY-like chemotaxis protein